MLQNFEKKGCSGSEKKINFLFTENIYSLLPITHSPSFRETIFLCAQPRVLGEAETPHWLRPTCTPDPLATVLSQWNTKAWGDTTESFQQRNDFSSSAKASPRDLALSLKSALQNSESFFKDFFLKANFQLTAKLRGRNRDFLYTPCPILPHCPHYQYPPPEKYLCYHQWTHTNISSSLHKIHSLHEGSFLMKILWVWTSVQWYVSTVIMLYKVVSLHPGQNLVLSVFQILAILIGM